jgi:hypothetical protein
MSSLDPTVIAASIKPDESTADHTLRALLLRRLDGDDEGHPNMPGLRDALATAWGLGLTDRGNLTPRGHEVARLLRPPRWTYSFGMTGPVSLKRPDGAFAWQSSQSQTWPDKTIASEAQRIADLLYDDDLRAAKRFIHS